MDRKRQAKEKTRKEQRQGKHKDTVRPGQG